ncbi:hypothetical protein H072_8643 [Dactylellina haptotyla CBS 200.50]|uniref:Uncharacterized protein n=1 Tax=Dactylellina haptotyla (strain CBS 200.50) TaxID=1284197 RepID=S8BQX2_DACHA|nr:hypothetical protein H072_8643 [Dactylellina haptotyla CBS 200.50]
MKLSTIFFAVAAICIGTSEATNKPCKEPINQLKKYSCHKKPSIQKYCAQYFPGQNTVLFNTVTVRVTVTAPADNVEPATVTKYVTVTPRAYKD